MGNAFGNYPSAEAAKADLQADGFTYADGYWRKRDMTVGSYAEAPRPCLALVTIERRKVAPQYGKPDYYQIEFH